MNRSYLLSCACFLASCSLANCSDGAIPSANGQGTAARQFSEEDKRVAQVLSIGSVGTLEAAKTPYAQNLLCSVAVESLLERVAKVTTLSAENRRAITQVRAYYRGRVDALAQSEGKSVTQVAIDRRDVARSNPEPQSNVRTAIACLQKAQAEA